MRRAIVSFLGSLLAIFIATLVLSSCKQRTPQQKTQAKQQETQTAQQDAYEEHPSHIYTREYYQRKKQAAPRKVENPVFAEWKSMRARRVPEGTEVRWRLRAYSVFPYKYTGDLPLWGMWDEFYAYLEGNFDYEVFCSKLRDSDSPFTVANGDWVEVRGKFRGVTPNGEVKLVLEELKNLGPGY